MQFDISQIIAKEESANFVGCRMVVDTGITVMVSPGIKYADVDLDILIHVDPHCLSSTLEKLNIWIVSLEQIIDEREDLAIEFLNIFLLCVEQFITVIHPHLS